MLNPIHLIQIKVFSHILDNISDNKIVDMIIDYEKREFKEYADKAVGATSDKLIRIALALSKRRPI